MRSARHRGAGSLATTWALLRAVSGEFGPGVRDYVVTRYVMEQVTLLAKREGLL